MICNVHPIEAQTTGGCSICRDAQTSRRAINSFEHLYAEIATLRAERDELRALVDSHDPLRAKVTALTEERDALATDAEQMRALRSRYDHGWCDGSGGYGAAQQVGEYPDGSPMVEEVQVQCAGCPECVGMVARERDAERERAEKAEERARVVEAACKRKDAALEEAAWALEREGQEHLAAEAREEVDRR